MSDSKALDYLREQFALINGKLDVMQGDIVDLKVLMSAVEAGMAELNRGFGRMALRRPEPIQSQP